MGDLVSRIRDFLVSPNQHGTTLRTPMSSGRVYVMDPNLGEQQSRELLLRRIILFTLSIGLGVAILYVLLASMLFSQGGTLNSHPLMNIYSPAFIAGSIAGVLLTRLVNLMWRSPDAIAVPSHVFQDIDGDYQSLLFMARDNGDLESMIQSMAPEES